MDSRMESLKIQAEILKCGDECLCDLTIAREPSTVDP